MANPLIPYDLEFDLPIGRKTVHLGLNATVFDSVDASGATALTLLLDHFISMPLRWVGARPRVEQLSDGKEIFRRDVKLLDIYRRAKLLDEDAIAELNTIEPDAVYGTPSIRSEIERRTRIAVHGRDISAIADARRWLAKVCIPTPEKHRKALPLLIDRHFFVFPRVYFDVVKIRDVGRRFMTAGRLNLEDADWTAPIRQLFPRARLKPAEWVCICSADASLESKPVVLASSLLAKALGYEERLVRKKLAANVPEWAGRRKEVEPLAKKTARHLFENWARRHPHHA